MGGSVLFSINKTSDLVLDKGKDESQLGCWCWTRYRGRTNHVLRIFWPTAPTSRLAPFRSTHNKDLLFWKGMIVAVQELLFYKICHFPSPKRRRTYIILMLDSNSNMRQSDLQLALGALHLREAILSRHGDLGPEKFHRNKNRTPIDGIWVSSGLVIEQCGYLHYDSIFTGAEHCCLWVELSFISTFGHNMPAIVHPKARRLHCRDPQVVNNYIKRYEALATKHNGRRRRHYHGRPSPCP
jgi:hypothetical protein